MAPTNWKQFLPWGDRAFATGCAFVVIAVAGATLGVAGDILSWQWLLAIGGIVAVFGILGGGLFIAVAIPFNAIWVWRSFKEAWNRPPNNQHKDWRP